MLELLDLQVVSTANELIRTFRDFSTKTKSSRVQPSARQLTAIPRLPASSALAMVDERREAISREYGNREGLP